MKIYVDGGIIVCVLVGGDVLFYYEDRDGDMYRVGGLMGRHVSYFNISSLLILDFLGFLGYMVGGNGVVPLSDYTGLSGLSNGYVNFSTTCCDVEFHLGYVLQTPVLDRYRGRCFYVLPHMSIRFNLLRGGSALGRARVMLSTLVDCGITFSWDKDDSFATDVVVRFLLDVFQLCCDGYFLGDIISLKVLFALFPGLQLAVLRFFEVLRGENIFWWGSDGLVYGDDESVSKVLLQWLGEYEDLWGYPVIKK